MSRGPGRIERAIRALFDAHPDQAFTTDYLCVACYSGLEFWRIERKHRVAVVRAAEKILAGDPNWRSVWSWSRGHTLIYFNAGSVPSGAMKNTLVLGATMHRNWVLERTQQTLYGQNKWNVEDRKKIERAVSQHLAVRNAADPVEAERLRAEHEAERAKRLAQTTSMLRALGYGSPAQALPNAIQVGLDNTKELAAGSPAQVLPSDSDCGSTTLTALAARVRTLITQNDPDAVRTGLAEIAAELDAWRGGLQ